MSNKFGTYGISSSLDCRRARGGQVDIKSSMVQQRAAPPMRNRSPVKLESLISLLESILPPVEKDVPFIYHKPSYELDTTSTSVGRMIFSVVPTRGVYTSFWLPRVEGVEVYFLHRPFRLVRHDTAKIWKRPRVVLSSHKVFDELLTVGWNTALARRLELDVERSICIRGYKTDLERRIGLLAPFASVARDGGIEREESLSSEHDTHETETVSKYSMTLLEQVRQQFGTIEKSVGFDDEATVTQTAVPTPDVAIRAIVVMNAFRREEVERIATLAAEAGFVRDAKYCPDILYLTGEPREEGIEAATERGMRVICVGHRTCEDWGIRYLMTQVQSAFPQLDVRLVNEPEELPPKKAAVLPKDAPRILVQPQQNLDV